MTPLTDAVVRTHRRWVVYTCPIHGPMDEMHARMDLQCPVVIKDRQCPHDLEGPVLVEEVHT